MARVTIDALTKRFGAVAAVDSVSLSIDAGEFVTLLGPSGCGKTTLLRAVAGLVVADAGRVLIDDQDVTALEPYQRELGMVFQSPALFPHMTVAQNVAFGLRMRRVGASDTVERVRAALKMMRLDEYEARYPRALSGGQQQRVAIARALVIKPRVLLMDEPFSALDRKLREAMQLELRELSRALGITVVFVTHDQEEALVLSDRIAVMRNGRLVQLGAPSEVFERPQTRFVADFMGFGNLLAGQVIDGATVAADAMRFACANSLAPGAAVTIGLRAERVSIDRSGRLGVPAQVVRAVYQGGTSAVTVKLEPSGLELLVRTAQRDLATGEKVGVQWAPDDVYVLRTDEA